MIKHFISVLTAVLLLFQYCCAVDVSARSAILYEPETKTILYSKNIDEKREIASTTKIMTAVVVLENCDVSEIVTVPKICVGIEGTSLYLREGERISVSDLLYGLMLQSGNDAAMALAYHIGNGSVDAFVEKMNQTAKRLGMNNSSFKNPNGLPAKEHFSTSRDMALLTAYAMSIPKFAEIVSTNSKKAGNRAFVNHNKLLRMYDGATGVKTGFTKAAGRCLVSSATRNSTSFIAVTLSAPDDWDDHKSLLDYGFNNYEVMSPLKANEKITALPVVGGEKNSVLAATEKDISFLVNKNDIANVKKEIYLPRFCYAPITCGEIIGKVNYVLNGKTIATCLIVCGESVSEFSNPSIIDKFFGLFRRE